LLAEIRAAAPEFAGPLGGYSRSKADRLLAFVCATSTYALGQKRYVEFTSSPGAIRLGGDGVAAPLLFDQDYAAKASYTALLTVLRQVRAAPR
jgi:hypothetical protein